MQTLQDLRFRPIGTVKKEDVRVSTSITFDDYVTSKEPGRMSNSFFSMSGHQVAEAIMYQLNKKIPDTTRNWGEFYVYRDHISTPGYVNKVMEWDTNSKLITPELPLSEICFERVIGVVDILGDGAHSMQLAIKYEADGHLEVAFGFNVKVCTNWNIFNAAARWEINKRAGVDFNVMMMKIEKELETIEERFGMNLSLISEMSQVKLAQNNIDQMLGHLLQQYHRDKPIINYTDISNLSRQLITSPNKTESLWDFVNRGTEVIRFDSSAGSTTFDDIQNFNSYGLEVLDRVKKRSQAQPA